MSDVAHLLMEHTHVGPKIGWLHVGHKGEKFRDIDLLNEARRPLYDYIQHGGREKEARTSLPHSEANTSPRTASTPGFVPSSGMRIRKNGSSSLLSAFMICAMILPIEHERLDGPLKKLPIILDMSP